MTNPCEYISDSDQSHRLSDDKLRCNYDNAQWLPQPKHGGFGSLNAIILYYIILKIYTNQYKCSLVATQWLKPYRITLQSRLGREASVPSSKVDLRPLVALRATSFGHPTIIKKELHLGFRIHHWPTPLALS